MKKIKLRGLLLKLKLILRKKRLVMATAK